MRSDEKVDKGVGATGAAVVVDEKDAVVLPRANPANRRDLRRHSKVVLILLEALLRRRAAEAAADVATDCMVMM
jgi:hypothetical protein